MSGCEPFDRDDPSLTNLSWLADTDDRSLSKDRWRLQPHMELEVAGVAPDALGAIRGSLTEPGGLRPPEHLQHATRVDRGR